MNGRALARGFVVALAANAVALAEAQAAAVWLLSQALVEIDSSLVGLVALALALLLGAAFAAAALTGAGRSPAARALLGLLALAIAVEVGWVIAVGAFHTLDLVSLPGFVVLLWAAVRPPARAALGRGPRALAIALTVAGAMAWGQAPLREARAEYETQRLPPFTIELVAAYHYERSGAMPAVVVDERGEIGDIVTMHGERYNLHRGDALRIAPSEVRRVRWISDGEWSFITLRVSDRAREALVSRARSRASQLDAVLIDGEPVGTHLHLSGPEDRIILSDPDRRALWRVYERLTDP